MRGKEKREYPRLDIHCLLRYRVVKSDFPESGKDALTIAAIKDISGNGILFRTEELLSPPELLELTINFYPIDKIVNTKAIVTRVEKIKGVKRYKIGATFMDISKEGQSSIAEFIKKIEHL